MKNWLEMKWNGFAFEFEFNFNLVLTSVCIYAEMILQGMLTFCQLKLCRVLCIMSFDLVCCWTDSQGSVWSLQLVCFVCKMQGSLVLLKLEGLLVIWKFKWWDKCEFKVSLSWISVLCHLRFTQYYLFLL